MPKSKKKIKPGQLVHKTTDPKYVIIDGEICNASTHLPIPPNEPIFILRAKDRKALRALRGYGSSCDNESHQEGVFARVKEFEAFRDKNDVREPDTEGELNNA